ncbi:MAG: hypothetical protein CMF62_03320 [Magnetococcales bacterium]|nr:hypothetical protein [Magnetococcales bacterium]
MLINIYLTYKKNIVVEGMSNSVNPEALANLSAMYNNGVLKVSELEVTGKTKLGDNITFSKDGKNGVLVIPSVKGHHFTFAGTGGLRIDGNMHSDRAHVDNHLRSKTIGVDSTLTTGSTITVGNTLKAKIVETDKLKTPAPAYINIKNNRNHLKLKPKDFDRSDTREHHSFVDLNQHNGHRYFGSQYRWGYLTTYSVYSDHTAGNVRIQRLFVPRDGVFYRTEKNNDTWGKWNLASYLHL